MDWSSITVGQFQDIYKLSQDADMDDIEKIERIICIMFNVTAKQVEEMTLTEFNRKAKECAFAMEQKDIPGRVVKKITVGAKLFKIEYNPMKLRHRQYVEILHYGEKPIENMHLIMASLVQPVKWGIARKNTSAEHAKIAEAMLDARLCDVYHSAVFFCKLYINLMQTLRPSLVADMTRTKKITKTEADELLRTSINAMAGFIQPSSLQTMSA